MAKVEKKRHSIVVTFVAVVLVACFAISLFSIIKKVNDTNDQIAAAEAALVEQQAENERMQEKINNSNNPEYIEEAAYENGYVHEGERVYQDISVID